MYAKYGVWNSNYDEMMRYFVWLLYSIEKKCLQGYGCIQCFIDLDGFDMNNTPHSNNAKEIIGFIGTMYPELLSKCTLLNAPSYFRAFWSVISPFLHENTLKKLDFLSGDCNYGSANAKILQDRFGVCWRNLILFGQPVFTEGACPGYDHDSEWKKVMAEEKLNSKSDTDVNQVKQDGESKSS